MRYNSEITRRGRNLGGKTQTGIPRSGLIDWLDLILERIYHEFTKKIIKIYTRKKANR